MEVSSDITTAAATDYDGSWKWNSATNWSIASGTLANTITFESSLSLIDDDDGGKPGGPTSSSSDGDSSEKKFPLILYPPSPDSTPCEISITFAQKHEVRQVYVRSTARVYEIYYGSEVQSSREYLCTVRCGLASRDDEVLCATDVEEAVLANLRSSAKGTAEEKLRNGNNNLTTNEDGWVEVKALDTSLPLSRNSSLLSKSDTNPQRSSQPQDFYEATAEMTDTSPCMFLTLRLLSLENKGCVCVDEVFIFVDPVDVTSSENQAGLAENSSGSSLMAMLMPTFFQLSKTKDFGRVQDKNHVDPTEKHKLKEVAPKEADPIVVGNQIHQEWRSSSGAVDEKEMKFQEKVPPPSNPTQLGMAPQASDIAGKPDTSYGCTEGVLDKLVSRVNKIEELVLRFEEKMLKPISSIDERLHRVEQQLEVLGKKKQASEPLTCTRIAAPEFSCSESETNSFYNSGSIHLSYVPCDANERDFSSGVLPIPSDCTPVSENTTKLYPSLVVTAPEFLNCEDEEENQAVPVKESPKGEVKHVVSIDEALTFALAGFLSSASEQSEKYLQTLSIKAPEFPNEEENNNDSIASTRVQLEMSVDSSTCLSEPDTSVLEKTNSLEKFNGNQADDNFDTVEGEAVRDKARAFKEVKAQFDGKQTDSVFETVEEQFDGNQTDNDTVERAAVRDEANASKEVDEKFDGNYSGDNFDTVGEEASMDEVSASKIVKKQSEELMLHSDTTKGGALKDEASASTEVKEQSKENNLHSDAVARETLGDEVSESTEVKELYKEHILQNLQHSPGSSTVDFEAPILDVKFISQEASNSMTPLEALLGNLSESNTEASQVEGCGSEGSDSSESGGDQGNLISMEDCGTASSGTDTHVSIDMNYCSLRDIPLETEKLQNCDTYSSSSSQEMAAASLI